MEQDDRQAAGSAHDYHQGELADVLAASTRNLVVIGAASALNCAHCLHHLIPAALRNGILAEEISAALAVASEIRACAGALTDDLGNTLVQQEAAPGRGSFGPRNDDSPRHSGEANPKVEDCHCGDCHC